MIIRKAMKEDANILNSLFAKLIENERKYYDENIKENLTMNGFFEKRIDEGNEIIFVAEEKSKILGYIYGYINVDNKIKKELEANIDSLFVIEEQRNKKIGTNLINKFIEEVKNKNCKYILIDNKYLNNWLLRISISANGFPLVLIFTNIS